MASSLCSAQQWKDLICEYIVAINCQEVFSIFNGKLKF